MTSIRLRLWLLALFPLITLAAGMFTLYINKTSELQIQQHAELEQRLIEVSKQSLRDRIATAMSVTKDASGNTLPYDAFLAKLRQMTFGGSDYIFIYDMQGNRVLVGNETDGIGDNFYDLQDAYGNYLIKALVQGAQNKNNFVSYHFTKPGGTIPTEKLSLSIYIPEHDFILGTGFYLDEMEETLTLSSQPLDNKTQDMLYMLGLLVTIIGLMVIFCAFININGILNSFTQLNRSVADFAKGTGNLTQRITESPYKEFKTLSFDFNQFLTSLQQMVTQIAGSSHNVNRHTETMIDALASNIALSEAQQVHAEHISVAMNQLTQCTQVVSQQLTEANTVTQTANESVVHSKDLLEKAVNHSEQLSHDLEHSSVEMQALESTVTNITSSLSVIEDIASQINLLALNAAIEAARAGEQGRGFAVVADEVRTLAYRTQESTGSISDMLTELRTATDDAVQSMQRGKTRSEQASQDTNIANDALQQVVANISHLKEVNNAINLAAMEQLQISESLAQKVCAMSEESASATKHAKSSLLLSQDMQNDAVDLQKLVSRFTL